MTRREIERLLEQWRARLLPEWHVEIKWDEPADEGSVCQVWRPADYQRAHIRIGPDLDRTNRNEVEATLIHELAHLLLSDLHEETVVDRLGWALQGLR